MRLTRYLATIAMLLISAVVVGATPPPRMGDFGHSLGDEEAVGVAKKLSNPISDLVAVPIQYTSSHGSGLTGRSAGQSVVIEPVYPVSLSGGDNLIVRPIVSVQMLNNVYGFSGTGIGNIQLQTFYTPAPTSSIVWGIGPYFISPAGSSGIFGSQQTGAGLSAIALSQQGPWTGGLLLAQSWSVGGSAASGTVNNSFYEPFVSYTTPSRWIFGASSSSTFNYDARVSFTQLSASVSKLVLTGTQPVSYSVGPVYNLGSLPGGPQGWGARATVTFIFQK